MKGELAFSAGLGAFLLTAAYFNKTRPCLLDYYPPTQCPFILPSLAAFGIVFAAVKLLK